MESRLPKIERSPEFILIFLLCLSFVIRFYKLEEYPLSVNQDELSNIYDAYSISETGADRWGAKHPLVLRGFGNLDYRPPMYAWLAAPSIKIFGFSVFAGRFTAVILGTLSLLLLYLVAKRIAGQMYALVVLLLATISPWHIFVSRLAHEGMALSSFFVILSFWLWLRTKETNYRFRDIALLGLALGLATNVYQASKLTSLVLCVVIGIELILKASAKFSSLFLFAASVFVGSLPQLFVAYTQPEHFFSRANEVVIPFSFSLNYFKVIFLNVYSNLSPHFLFYSLGELNNLTQVRFLMLELPFFYLGLLLLYNFVKKKNTINPLLIYGILFLSILPSSLTRDNPHALRNSSASLFMLLFTGAGILFIFENLRTNFSRYAYLFLTVILLVFNACIYIVWYAASPDQRGCWQQHQLVDMSKRINSCKEKYDQVFIEDNGNQAYLYIASFCGFSPEKFQNCSKDFRIYDWDHFYRLDKYWFLNREILDTLKQKPGERNLYVFLQKPGNRHFVDSLESSGFHYYFYEE